MLGLIDFCLQRNIFENEVFTFSVMFIYTLNLICTFGLYSIYIDFRKEYVNEKKQCKKR